MLASMFLAILTLIGSAISLSDKDWTEPLNKWMTFALSMFAVLLGFAHIANNRIAYISHFPPPANAVAELPTSLPDSP